MQEHLDAIQDLYNNDLPESVYIHFINNGFDLANFDDMYQGKYDSDADFAMYMHESINDTSKDNEWPYNCIDWKQAANDLMHDYFEIEGHYFRAY